MILGTPLLPSRSERVPLSTLWQRCSGRIRLWP